MCLRGWEVGGKVKEGFKKHLWELPGGPVVKTCYIQCRGLRFDTLLGS